MIFFLMYLFIYIEERVPWEFLHESGDYAAVNPAHPVRTLI